MLSNKGLICVNLKENDKLRPAAASVIPTKMRQGPHFAINHLDKFANLQRATPNQPLKGGFYNKKIMFSKDPLGTVYVGKQMKQVIRT